MNIGRNDPCHCGSGKKYKKCCLDKDEEARRKEVAPPPAPSNNKEKASDPHIVAWNARYEEFEAGDYEARIRLFERTLDEVELMDGEMAFEMLSDLFEQAAERNESDRYDLLIESLREQLPDVYKKEAHYLLEKRILNALVMKRPEAVRTLTLELAELAGDQIDIWNLVESRLAYHGYLDTLVEAMRLAWPKVHASNKIVPWGISEFNDRALQYEILNYVAKTPEPKGDDSALLERLRFFEGEDVDVDRTRVIVGYLSGQTERQWVMDDFELAPSNRHLLVDPARLNLYDLIIQFVNYAHRIDDVAWTKANLASDKILSFIVMRKAGELEYRESMLDSMLRSAGQKRGPIKKYRRYGHLLCPDSERLDTFLARDLQLLNRQLHKVAATMELIPAWIRFLETQRLIDPTLRKETLESLKPLIGSLLEHFASSRSSDPSLHEAIKRCSEDLDKEL